MPKMPGWKTPKNIVKALAEGDGMWEDERWYPILLTAMSDTELDGRDVPIAWQIEFDPYEVEFETANTTLKKLNIEPDGNGWGEYIQKAIAKDNPALVQRLHTLDCEIANCVIWVESAEDCRMLLETTWKLVFET